MDAEPVPVLQVAKDMLQAYCKLVRRGIGDVAATSAAMAAGVSVSGELLAPLDQIWVGGAHADNLSLLVRSAVEPSMAKNWGVDALVQCLYLVRTDLTRLEGALPELSPTNRCVQQSGRGRHVS